MIEEIFTIADFQTLFINISTAFFLFSLGIVVLATFRGKD